MIKSLEQHWPEYLIEAAGLGIFMMSACLFTVLVYHPASPIAVAVSDQLARRVLMGVAMATTALALIYSPWGQRSGAHFNPALTWTFFRLGKIKFWDALFYALSQFAGGLAGVAIVSAVFHSMLAHPSVSYAVTAPGPWGPLAAFLAETLISFVLMSVVLRASNSTLSRMTGVFAAGLICLYITFEAPYSGMSMNPARTLASAAYAHFWNGLWIYFLAPPLGMLLAAEMYRATRGVHNVFCAKLVHGEKLRCIFLCNFGELQKTIAARRID